MNVPPTNRRVFIKYLLAGCSMVVMAPSAMGIRLKRKKASKGTGPYIPIDRKERCPVCGMFVWPYPKWITQIQFHDGRHHSFDGMKCFCRFYFQPEKFNKTVQKKDFNLLLVRDYYTMKFIQHEDAYYVVGSDVLGPMGHELIPFFDQKRAKIFLIDHRGLKMMQFKEVTPALLDKLDKAKKTLVLD
jgi:copper chaperone NosL